VTTQAILTTEHVAAALEEVRRQAPLVQCITNDVAMDIAANAVLAVGASPAMVSDPGEAAEFARIASALTVNIGTPHPRLVEGMQVAAAAAAEVGRPWVLDPVAVGATALRNEICGDLVARRPAVIRANASEVLALSTLLGLTVATGRGRGVDAGDTVDDAVGAARVLARRLGAVVAVTGAVDVVTDGTQEVRLTGGHPLMARVTATGCALTAVTGAFVAAADDAFTGAVAACAVFAAAGTYAGAAARGPGSLRTALLDELATLDGDRISGGVRVEEVAL
jgi:hydroxyethylthiazole kinase